MIISKTPKRLRRKEASKYLKAKHGIDRTPGTLAKIAVTGGSPPFQYDGRIPLYPIDELDKWAESILSPLKRSTSGNRTSYSTEGGDNE